MDKRYILIISLIIVVAVIVGSLFFLYKKTKKPELPSVAFSTSTAIDSTDSVLNNPVLVPETTIGSPESEPTVSSEKNKLSSNSTAENLSYGDAVNKYLNRRVQFNDYCNATPSSMVIKSEAGFMIDNRSSGGRSFNVDGKKYYVNGYGFKTFLIRKSRLPYTVKIDCGSGRNNAQIILN
ncbi:hypothetical protein HY227_01135 [Candidatus Wolfebacteria bacterium]|nr:hypothetical protein [Candidatus Wolfebacteria bacterium]